MLMASKAAMSPLPCWRIRVLFCWLQLTGVQRLVPVASVAPGAVLPEAVSPGCGADRGENQRFKSCSSIHAPFAAQV